MHPKKRLALLSLLVVLVLSNANTLGSIIDIKNESPTLLQSANDRSANAKSGKSAATQTQRGNAHSAAPEDSTTPDVSSVDEGDSAENTPEEQNTPEDSTEIAISPQMHEKIGKELEDKLKEDPNSTVNVIAEFDKKLSQTQVNEIGKSHRGSVKNHYKNLKAATFQLPASAIESLAKRSDVKRMDLDFEVKTVLDTSREAIQIDTLRSQYDYTGRGVKVAVIDTGVDKAHPALAQSVVEAVDFTGEGPQDLNGHGTHVSCIIACNDATYSGVAPGAEIYSAKALHQDGSGTASDILAALDWAMGKKVDIINMSLGGYVSNCGSDVFSQIINQVDEAGFLPVVAAGNSGPNAGTILSPGCAQNALTVGASLEDQSVASFSSVGPTAEGVVKPDLVAPGVGITAAFPGGRFATLSGTSMATPHIAGLAAVLLEAKPGTSHDALKKVMKENAKDLQVDSNIQGSGLAQGLNAVEVLLGSTPSTPEDDNNSSEDDVNEPEVNEPSEDESPDTEEPDTGEPEEDVANLFGKCVSEAARDKTFTPLQKKAAIEDCLSQFQKAKQEARQTEGNQQTGDSTKESSDAGVSPEGMTGESLAAPSSDSSNIQSDDFEDTPEKEWFYPYIYSLKSENCIQGYADGQFRPGQEVTWGETLKMLTRCILGQDLGTSSTGHWAKNDLDYIRTTYQNQLSKELSEKLAFIANDADLQLNGIIDRKDAVALMTYVLSKNVPVAVVAPFRDVPLSDPSVDAIAYAKNLGIVSGQGDSNLFLPDKFLSRAEMAKMVFIAKQLAAAE